MTAIEKPWTGGDFLVHRESEIVCIEGAAVKNATLADGSVAQIAGYPVKLNAGEWELVIATDEANATGFLIHGPAIVDLPAGESTKAKYSILARGPGAVNGAKFATKDLAGADFTVATLKTAAEGLDVVVVREESPTQSEQTT